MTTITTMVQSPRSLMRAAAPVSTPAAYDADPPTRRTVPLMMAARAAATIDDEQTLPAFAMLGMPTPSLPPPAVRVSYPSHPSYPSPPPPQPPSPRASRKPRRKPSRPSHSSAATVILFTSIGFLVGGGVMLVLMLMSSLYSSGDVHSVTFSSYAHHRSPRRDPRDPVIIQGQNAAAITAPRGYARKPPPSFPRRATGDSRDERPADIASADDLERALAGTPNR